MAYSNSRKSVVARTRNLAAYEQSVPLRVPKIECKELLVNGQTVSAGTQLDELFQLPLAYPGGTFDMKVRCARVGNTATLSFLAFSATFSQNGTVTSTTPLPAAYRPASDFTFMIPVDLPTAGILHGKVNITSSGNVQFFPDLNGPNFSAGANTIPADNTGVTYSVLPFF